MKQQASEKVQQVAEQPEHSHNEQTGAEKMQESTVRKQEADYVPEPPEIVAPF